MNRARRAGFRFLRGALLIATLALGLLPVAASAQGIGGDDGYRLMLPLAVSTDAGQVMEYAVPAGARRALRDYSSYATRAAVRPLAAPVYPLPALAAEEATAFTGEPGWSPGGLPAQEADAVARATNGEEWARIEAAERAQAESTAEELGPALNPFAEYGTANTFASFRTNAYGKMWTTYPYRAVGKLLVYDDGVYAGYCSASVIGPKNMVVTAAHCVYDRAGTGWYDAYEFIPAYRDGAAPFGTWIANNAQISLSYRDTGAAGQNVALVSLDYKHIDGAWRPVSYYTGWLGRVWDYDETQVFFAMGYPQGMDGGKYSYTCAAESFPSGETDLMGLGCNMEDGAYGGPWIYKFHPYRGWYYNYVGGVGVNASESTMDGVRFSSANIVRLCAAANWDCGDTAPRQ